MGDAILRGENKEGKKIRRAYGSPSTTQGHLKRRARAACVCGVSIFCDNND